MKTNPNEPINPAKTNIDHITFFENAGLTKREYFAALSLQGLNANGRISADAAWLAVVQADMLIKELNKEAP